MLDSGNEMEAVASGTFIGLFKESSFNGHPFRPLKVMFQQLEYNEIIFNLKQAPYSSIWLRPCSSV